MLRLMLKAFKFVTFQWFHAKKQQNEQKNEAEHFRCFMREIDICRQGVNHAYTRFKTVVSYVMQGLAVYKKLRSHCMTTAECVGIYIKAEICYTV